LKVSQFRVEFGGEMKSPAAELAATGRSDFRACYISVSALPTQTVLQPNPAQQAATTLRGDAERARHILTVCKSKMYVNRRNIKFPQQAFASGGKVRTHGRKAHARGEAERNHH
jgi:hypothetical protein